MAAWCAVLTGLLASCGRSGPQTPHGLGWHTRKDGQCATLAVPLDYSHPGGAVIKLALFRIGAKDPHRRICVLLINPGGPGESGVDFLRSAKDAVSDPLAARFDLVSWDPRGTGASDPVRCGLGFGRAVDRPLPLPTTAARRQAQAAAAQRADQSCKQTAGAILGHVGTVNTARDLDRIRAALGAKRLSYIGYSYGTYLGQIYANMFPAHVRAMVLDGVSDANLSPEQLLLAEARGSRAIAQARL
jgi:pimeloyl-ACP methyl ester carboxylesterase